MNNTPSQEPNARICVSGTVNRNATPSVRGEDGRSSCRTALKSTYFAKESGCPESDLRAHAAARCEACGRRTQGERGRSQQEGCQPGARQVRRGARPLIACACEEAHSCIASGTLLSAMHVAGERRRQRSRALELIAKHAGAYAAEAQKTKWVVDLVTHVVGEGKEHVDGLFAEIVRERRPAPPSHRLAWTSGREHEAPSNRLMPANRCMLLCAQKLAHAAAPPANRGPCSFSLKTECPSLARLHFRRRCHACRLPPRPRPARRQQRRAGCASTWRSWRPGFTAVA
jgi:hypothetical protein